MRIALVTTWPRKGEPPSGGVQTSSVNLVQGLTALDLDVTVFDIATGNSARSVEDWSGVRVVRLAVGPAVGRIHRTRGQLREVNAGYDIVHYQAVARVAEPGPTSLLTVHGLIENELAHESGGSMRQALKRMAVVRPEIAARARFPHLIAVSDNVLRTLPLNASRRTWVVPNAVDDVFAQASRARTNGRIVTVGKLSALKNPMDVVEVLERITPTVPEAHAVFVGDYNDAEFERSFMARVSASPVADHITITGALPPQRVAGLLATASVLLLTSHTEVAPMVIAEAFTCGVPVVATAVGGVPDMLTPGTGMLVTPGDLASLTAAAKTVLQRSPDTDTLLKAARRYSAASVAQRTLAVYRDLAGR